MAKANATKNQAEEPKTTSGEIPAGHVEATEALNRDLSKKPAVKPQPEPNVGEGGVEPNDLLAQRQLRYIAKRSAGASPSAARKAANA